MSPTSGDQQGGAAGGLLSEIIMVLVAVLSAVLILQLIKLINKRIHLHKTFARMQVPGPKPNFFHGHLYETRRQPYTRFAHKMHEAYGKNVGVYLGEEPFLITTDLDLIQQVFVAKSRIFYDRMNFYLNVDPVPDNLICQRGDRWRYMRKLLTPAFTNSKIRSSQFYRDTQQTIGKFMEQLKKQARSETSKEANKLKGADNNNNNNNNNNSGKERRFVTYVDDVYDRMAAVALDVIIKTAFHMDNMISFDGPLNEEINSLLAKGKSCKQEPLICAPEGIQNSSSTGGLGELIHYTVEWLKSLLIGQSEEEVSSKRDAFLNTAKRACRLALNPLVELIICFPLLDLPLTYLCNHLYFGSIIKLLFNRLDYLVKRQQPGNNGQANSTSKGDQNGTLATVDELNENHKNKRRIIDSLIEVLREKKITRSEFTGNAFVIVFAGFETTANALTFTLWLLARHPRVQTKLREELLEKMSKLKRKAVEKANNNDEIEGETDEDIELVELALSSDYLEWTINESLRLYPPVPGLSCRKASETCRLANGLTIEKGVNVCPSVFSIHRDKQIWGEQASEFMPERFSLLDITQLNSAMFMPFGFGPRNCIGKALALHELKIAIGRLVLEYSIEFWPHKTPEKMRLCSPINITITSADKIGLRFVKLNSN